MYLQNNKICNKKYSDKFVSQKINMYLQKNKMCNKKYSDKFK